MFRNTSNYRPSKGFIGKFEVDVANYLFSPRLGFGYTHSQSLVETILGKSVQENYESSQRITQFLKKRDLTFQKLQVNGEYRIFTVPVSTSVVPLPKSVFNTVETSAQILMVSLRKVLQSIYGSPSIRESDFVKSLPFEIQKTFLQATENSPHYIPALHHPCMKEYPFFDNVGLDLVLVDHYFEKRGELSKLISQNRVDEIPELPFRVLELNAGSPSGASNNANILEGILREDPSLLDSLGKVMPNDHFEVLKNTYQSLGESWTKRVDGVQVILPPGGSNGASPEIHQLAAYSGLIYCDPGQLFQDEEGWVRLRTVNNANPIVTAIYSRVNSDSALFSKEEKILLRDPESGESIYCKDYLNLDKNGEPQFLKDETNQLIPLESEYAIPGGLHAVLNRKLYLGGLNRLLDNKIILATLTEFAPQFFRDDLLKLGLPVDGPTIQPPECLPSKDSSLDIIEKDPSEWVIKAPNLSGGNGVYILMTLDPKKRKEVIALARKSPEEFAYQRLVKIGRIPVAVRDHSKEGFRFANLAADIRMWVFYGGNETLPRLTHNALVRYAPKEKGPMSSIVNTSMGGGYAPFVVTDDLGLKDSISARELAMPKEPSHYKAEMPTFVGAQMVQVANIIDELRGMVRNPHAELHRAHQLLLSLKTQVREIASFIHPRCMETVYSMLERVEGRLKVKALSEYHSKLNHFQAKLVSLLKLLEPNLSEDFFMVLDEFNVLNQDLVNRGYPAELRRRDLFNFGHLNFVVRKLVMDFPEAEKELKKLQLVLKQMIQLEFPFQNMTGIISQRLETLLDQFCDLAMKRLSQSVHSEEFSKLFKSSQQKSALFYEETFMIPHSDQAPRSASEWEVIHQCRMAESSFVEPEIKSARESWLNILAEAKTLSSQQKTEWLNQAREAHFKKFPRLAELQKLIDLKHNDDPSVIIELMSIMPHAAYNLRQFAIEKGVQFHELFESGLAPEHFSILSFETRKKEKLSLEQFAGECFAKKKSKHGLISESDRYLWVAQEQSPFIQLYTIGHELIHAAQIKEIIEMEKAALKMGGLDTARFLNFYGNFLSVATHALESHETDLSQVRKPLYGLADRCMSESRYASIKEIRNALELGTEAYEAVLTRYGSLHGYMMPVGNSIKVKALREVVPALENAKNIIFAKECGLLIKIDEVSSALPTANSFQRQRYRSLITQAAQSHQFDHEALRVIASHQYHGVMFPRAEDPSKNLIIETDPAPIALNTGYNQTQQ